MTGIGFDVGQGKSVGFAGETDGLSPGASASGTANAVDIVFCIFRQVEIDHVGHIRNVQTTCCHVCGHQDIEFSTREPL